MLQCEWSSVLFFFFSSRRRHTRLQGDWSSDVCSSDLTVFCRTCRKPCGSCRPRSRACGPRARLDRVAEKFITEVTHERRAANRFAEEQPAAPPKKNEIGRASCRERV